MTHDLNLNNINNRTSTITHVTNSAESQLKFNQIFFKRKTICFTFHCTRHQARYIATHHLTSGISFLTHFINHVLICLFLIHLFSTIISPHQCHHHHSYHPSPHHSSIPNSKLSYFSNPTLHRHLARLRTDFMDTRTALRLFSVSVFFSKFTEDWSNANTEQHTCKKTTEQYVSQNTFQLRQ